MRIARARPLAPTPARACAAAVLGLALTLAAPAARADDAHALAITSLDGEAWAAFVERVERDPATADTRVELVVTADGARVPCGSYQLALDDVGAAAFALGACDPDTQATALRVVSRAALFAPGDPVPRPLPAAIHASIVRRGEASGGGAAPGAGAELWCTVALAPYLWDGLAGRPVALSPDRYRIEPVDADGAVDAGVQVLTAGDGWVARGDSRAALTFRYRAVDARTGAVVLTDEATLACADQPRGTGAAAAPLAASLTASPAAPPPPLPALGFEAMLFSSAGVLVHDLDGLRLLDGRPATAVTGSRHGVYYGTVLGVAGRIRGLYVALRWGLYYDRNACAMPFSLGVGLVRTLGDDVTVYAAPVARATMLAFTDSTPGGGQGEFGSLDAALLAGLRWRFPGGSTRGLTVETEAPIGGARIWQVMVGISFAPVI